MRFKLAKAKAKIAANSKAIGKIGNADIGVFGLMETSHELISTSLSADVSRAYTDYPQRLWINE